MASCTASAMATSCRCEVPEARTKKSVKAEPLRRSRTTTSSAFLSRAAAAALRTADGIFIVRLPPGRASTVQPPLVDVVGHGAGHEVSHAAAGPHTLAEVPAGDGQGRPLD